MSNISHDSAEHQPVSEREVMLAEINRLKDEWDTQYASMGHFVVDGLLNLEQAKRDSELNELRKVVKEFTRPNKNTEAGSYEPFDLQQDVFREIIYRAIARLNKSQPLDDAALKSSYQQLDRDLSKNELVISADLIDALNSGSEHQGKIKYIEIIGVICDFIMQAEVQSKQHRQYIERAIYWPIRGGASGGFRVEEARKLRIRQDVILNLLGRLDKIKVSNELEVEQKPAIEGWAETLKRVYLPAVNQTKISLYKLHNRLEKLIR